MTMVLGRAPDPVVQHLVDRPAKTFQKTKPT
jgi:hypothetical protein